MTTDELSDVLTISEIASTLHVSYPSAWRLVARGVLPSGDMGRGQGKGRMTRVLRDDLVTYLAETNRNNARMRHVHVTTT